MKWLLPLLLLIAGCDPVQPVADAITGTTTAVQETALPATNTVALAATDAVDSVLPPPPTASPRAEPPFRTAGVALVVRWEIGSEAQYRRKYSHPICPGGASGPTIGIGADLGTQTQREIRAAWGWHPAIESLVTASGQTGPKRCAAWVAAHRGITVDFVDAERVFLEHDWPRYEAAAGRAYSNGWSGNTGYLQQGLTSVGYNRGFGFDGSRRAELRTIRDTCVPAYNSACSADQNRASCRVWEGTTIYKGICARRRDESRLMVR